MFNKNKQSSLDEEIKSCQQYFSIADWSYSFLVRPISKWSISLFKYDDKNLF